TGAITGREAGPKERGKVFGLLGMTIGLGALAGGLSIGPMVDAWGYRRMFTVMAAFLLIIPLAALVMVRETSSVSEKAVQGPVKQRGRFEKVLFLLFAAQIFGMIANGLGNMARSISMSGLSFTNTAITTTAAVSGLIAIPLALFLGWLSDKLGRKLILIISHAAGTLCLVLLVISFRLWHFWIAASLLSIVVVSMSVGPAFVADIVKKESVGTGIALFQGAQWLGIIAGFVYSGYAFKAMGFSSSLFAASGTGIIAALLILFLRTSPPAGDSGR
ncbi:MAG: MFS transporter, partial [Spirochaetales bacterium]